LTGIGHQDVKPPKAVVDGGSNLINAIQLA
jgi:hypothetical protein